MKRKFRKILNSLPKLTPSQAVYLHKLRESAHFKQLLTGMFRLHNEARKKD